MVSRIRFVFIVIIISVLSLSSRAATTQPSFQFAASRVCGGMASKNTVLLFPWLAEHNMNFLMFCYSSFPASGKDWRPTIPPVSWPVFMSLLKQADKLGVELCLSFNPGIWSNPPLTYSSETDYQLAWKKVRTVHAQGVHSFALCLDDINTKLQPADAERFKTLESRRSIS